MDGQSLSNLGTKVADYAFGSVKGDIGVSYQPFFISIFEDFVERSVDHLGDWDTFYGGHFVIAVSENEVYTVPACIKDQFNDTKSQWHIVQQAAFLKQIKRKMMVCIILQCIGQIQRLPDLFMLAYISLPSLKDTSIRHSIQTII